MVSSDPFSSYETPHRFFMRFTTRFHRFGPLGFFKFSFKLFHICESIPADLKQHEKEINYRDQAQSFLKKNQQILDALTPFLVCLFYLQILVQLFSELFHLSQLSPILLRHYRSSNVTMSFQNQMHNTIACLPLQKTWL